MILAGKHPQLSLMAVTTEAGAPAAMTLAEIEAYPGDARPQPVGLVSSVGTSAGWTDPTAPRRRSPARAIAAPVLVPAGNLRTTKRFCS